jgi:hypothetical protein
MVLVVLVIIVVLLAVGIWLIMQLRSVSLKSLTLGWRLLWLSGLLFVPGGILWLTRWEPSWGPYAVGERYPFGSDVQAWEVSMGFAFVAFGILFSGATILACKARSRWAWTALLLSWVLLMLPHAVIVLAFIIDDSSLGNLGASKFAIPFAVVWLCIVVAGFVLSGREVWKLSSRATYLGDS